MINIHIKIIETATGVEYQYDALPAQPSSLEVKAEEIFFRQMQKWTKELDADFERSKQKEN